MLTYFCVENVPEFQYCYGLFTDVDIFFMCKMLLPFPIDVLCEFVVLKHNHQWHTCMS